MTEQKLAFRRTKQLNALYSQARLALLASIVCGSVLIAVVFNTVPIHNLSTWGGLMVVVALMRFFVMKVHHRHENHDVHLSRWRFIFAATLFASGAAWGTASYLLAPSAAIADQAIVVIFICGFVAAGVAAFSVDRLAFCAFSGPALGFPIVNLATRGDTASQILAGVLTMFGTFLLANALRSNKAHKLEFDTQFDNQLLAAKLNDEKTKISELATDLEVRVRVRTEELTIINQQLKHRIDEKNKAVEETKIQESRFLEVFDQAPIGMLVVHAESGEVVRANDAICQLLGYQAEELNGIRAEQLLCPSERAKTDHESIFEQAGVNERRYMHRQGFVVWGRTSTGSPVGSEHGEMHYVIQVEDLSELKRARDDLTDRNDSLDTAFQAAPIGMAVVDSSGRIMKGNTSLRAILNLSDDLEGRSLTSILNAVDEEHNSGVLARLFTGELDSIEFEHRLFGTGDTSKLVVVQITRVKGQLANKQFAVVHVRDKTPISRQTQPPSQEEKPTLVPIRSRR